MNTSPQSLKYFLTSSLSASRCPLRTFPSVSERDFSEGREKLVCVSNKPPPCRAVECSTVMWLIPGYVPSLGMSEWVNCSHSLPYPEAILGTWM